MTLTLTLPAEVERKLRACATAAGVDVETFLRRAVEEKLRSAPMPTFEEVTAPFAKAVEASGMTEEEFDSFFEEIRDEVWREKNTGQSKRS